MCILHSIDAARAKLHPLIRVATVLPVIRCDDLIGRQKLVLSSNSAFLLFNDRTVTSYLTDCSNSNDYALCSPYPSVVTLSAALFPSNISINSVIEKGNVQPTTKQSENKECSTESYVLPHNTRWHYFRNS